MRYIQILLIAILAISGATPTANAASPKESVEKAGKILREAESVTASFSFSGSDIAGNGSITIAGNKFKMSVGDVAYWYNGKTLWSYFKANSEVYVSEPTAEELAEINPVSLLNSITGQCTYTSIKARTGKTAVKCTAKSTTLPFSSMTVTLDAANHPTAIKVVPRQGDTVTLSISNLTIGKAIKASTFTFNPKDAPGADVIDMR